MASPNVYLVAILTYCRSAELVRMLDSLVGSADGKRAQILVVDNDPAQSAESIVEEHPLEVLYVNEPRPGIASARNRALDHFNERFAAVIFIDDDEWVEPSWFEELVGYAERTDADVVQGPVMTIIPEDAPAWVRKGQFFQRRLEVTGAVLQSASTNNVLLTRRAWVRAGCPRFDDAFSVTGGSDYDFFWGVRKSGAEILYCAEAVVYEDVPISRLDRGWIRRRYTRNGIGILRSHRKHGESVARLLATRAVAFIAGVFQITVDVATGRGLRAAPLERVLKSVGVFSGLAGYRIEEYKR